MLRGEAFAGAPGEHRLAQFDLGEGTVSGRLAQFVEQVAEGRQQRLAAIALVQGSGRRAAQQAVDRRQANGTHGETLSTG